VTVLRERYARGELSDEEFEQRRERLLWGRRPPSPNLALVGFGRAGGTASPTPPSATEPPQNRSLADRSGRPRVLADASRVRILFVATLANQPPNASPTSDMASDGNTPIPAASPSTVTVTTPMIIPANE
jgi:hypothetical protein